MERRRRFPRWLRVAFWILTPVWLIALWVGFNFFWWHCEIWRLDLAVDDSQIPAHVVAKDGKNGWPFGMSNGAYVRVHWLLLTDDEATLRTFVEDIEPPKDATVRLAEIRDVPAIFLMEVRNLHSEQSKCFLLTVEAGRGQYWWEIPS